MGRVLAIDYGSKRVGLAVTDSMKIIASPLTTVASNEVIQFIKNYHEKEELDKVVIGLAKNLDNTDTNSTKLIDNFVIALKRSLQGVDIITVDERLTSKMAQRSMVDMGMKKSDRQKKENIDKISATLILQTYLDTTIS